MELALAILMELTAIWLVYSGHELLASQKQVLKPSDAEGLRSLTGGRGTGAVSDQGRRRRGETVLVEKMLRSVSGLRMPEQIPMAAGLRSGRCLLLPAESFPAFPTDVPSATT
jgi:hypothetical protein